VSGQAPQSPASRRPVPCRITLVASNNIMACLPHYLPRNLPRQSVTAHDVPSPGGRVVGSDTICADLLTLFKSCHGVTYRSFNANLCQGGQLPTAWSRGQPAPPRSPPFPVVLPSTHPAPGPPSRHVLRLLALQRSVGAAAPRCSCPRAQAHACINQTDRCAGHAPSPGSCRCTGTRCT